MTVTRNGPGSDVTTVQGAGTHEKDLEVVIARAEMIRWRIANATITADSADSR